jgi:hypothetical protein
VAVAGDLIRCALEEKLPRYERLRAEAVREGRSTQQLDRCLTELRRTIDAFAHDHRRGRFDRGERRPVRDV